MDQDQLEKLVRTSSNGNGYRGSLAVEATEVLEFIRANRPDLYEHILSEAKRQEKSANIILAKMDTEIDFSNISKSLENTITLQENGQTLAYQGNFTDLYWNFEKKEVEGNAKLLKLVIVPVKKKKWKLFPPSITEVEVQQLKNIWKINSYQGYRSSIIEKGKTSHEYRKRLISNAQYKKYLLPPSLLSAVFDSMDQKLLEIYNSYKF